MASKKLGSYVSSSAVVSAAAGFLAFAATETRAPYAAGPRWVGYFSSSNGLSANAPVEIGGVKVGRVIAISLDLKSFLSKVVFTVDRRVGVPDDSSLVLQGEGTSSSVVLSLIRGKSPKYLLPGAAVLHTVPASSLEHDIGDYIFGNGGLAEAN